MICVDYFLLYLESFGHDFLNFCTLLKNLLLLQWFEIKSRKCHYLEWPLTRDPSRICHFCLRLLWKRTGLIKLSSSQPESQFQTLVKSLQVQLIWGPFYLLSDFRGWLSCLYQEFDKIIGVDTQKYKSNSQKHLKNLSKKSWQNLSIANIFQKVNIFQWFRRWHLIERY